MSRKVYEFNVAPEQKTIVVCSTSLRKARVLARRKYLRNPGRMEIDVNRIHEGGYE